MPITRKLLNHVFHALAAFIGVAILALLLLVGRLMYGPAAITSLTPALEYLLSQPQYGVHAKITQSLAGWDKDKKQIVLDLSNVQFNDGLGQAIANIPQVLLVLQPLGYFDETHSPWIVNVRRPYMHVRIDAKGVLRLGALASGNNENEKPQIEKEEIPIDMGSAQKAVSDIIHAPHIRAAGLGLFANLNIEEAGITIIDEPNMSSWNITVPKLSLKRTGNDYKGSAAMLVRKADLEAKLDFSLNYDARTDRFQAAWSFDHVNPSLFTQHVKQLKALEILSAPLTGSIAIDFDEEFKVHQGALTLNLDKGSVNVPSLYAKPLAFSAGQLVARYDLEKAGVTIDPVRLDLDHAVLHAVAHVDVNDLVREVEATFTLEKLDVTHLGKYWPEGTGGNARPWVLQNITKGMIDTATTKVMLTISQDNLAQATLNDVSGSLAMRDVDLICWPPLPPLKNVKAKATFTDKSFDIDVLEGQMEKQVLKPSHVVISGLDEVDQIMAIDAHLAGPADNLLSILDRDPLGYARKININPKGVEGNVQGNLKMRFPLWANLPFEKIELDATSKVENGKIVKIADLLAVDNANVTIQVTKDKLLIDGKGGVNGVPSVLAWEEIFAPTANQNLSHGAIFAQTQAQNIKNFGVGFDVRTDKPIPFHVDYQRGAKTSRLEVSADAKAATLTIPDIAFTKKAGLAGDLNAILEWGGGAPMRLTHLGLKGGDFQVKGDGVFDAAGKDIARLTLNPIKIGRSDATLIYTKTADLPLIKIEGNALDVSGMLEGNDKSRETDAKRKPSPLQIDMRLKRLITGEKSALTGVVLKASRTATGWEMIDLSSRVANGTVFNFYLNSSKGMRTVKASAPDFGNVLESFGAANTLIGGTLLITGKSEKDDPEKIFGHIKLEKFRVKNMPVVAQLISAISPDGIASLLSGSGLGFDELYGEYTWKGDVIKLDKAHTSTGSLGLTTAGTIDLADNRIALKGQVIPVVFISRILSNIPIVGDILTGGDKGGLFSATYGITGPLADPDVSINPVSVLAPGIIRDILFLDKGAAPDSSKKEE